MSKKSQSSGNITVGDISNSNGIAIGRGAHASVDHPPPVDAVRVIARLDDLVRSIDVYTASLENAVDIRKSLMDARSEASKPTPRWNRVRDTLERVRPLLEGVTALSTMLDNIRTLVGHG